MESGQAKGLIKGLETWAKKVTSGYRDVNVRDMSSSFRDGLAFCAIIHHYRPDLIDFESLSKENILQNNSLAFSTAEKQLGVPALLDAEDMVQYSRPDRLSIITYLSQLHNCFINQNKVNALKPGVRRKTIGTEGPPPKIPSVTPTLLAAKRHEVCHSCNHRVFILERLIVDGKLYHTTCFRCNKCNSLLNPGAYVESDTAGRYECAVCLPDEGSNSMESQDSESCNSNGDMHKSLNDTPIRSPSPRSQRNITNKSPLTESVTHARNNFLQNSLSSKPSEVKKDSPVIEKGGPFPKEDSPSLLRKDSPSFLRKDSPSFLRKDSPSFQRKDSPFLRNSMSSIDDIKGDAMKDESVDSGVSVKDKINVFESTRNSRPESFFKSSELRSSTNKKQSPITATDNEVLPLNKSKTSAIVSPNSPSTVDSSGNSTPSSVFSANLLDTKTRSIAALNSAQLIKSPEKAADDTSTAQNDKQNCDDATPVTLHNKVPTPAHFRHSLQFQALSTEADKSKESIKPFPMGEYKSPLKTSRDIFQTNLQPLKLSIPTITSSSKRESMVKSGLMKSAEIPQITSSYAKTLPRQNSAGSFSMKEKSNDVVSSSNNFTDASPLQWNRTIPRRSSLESQGQNPVISDVKLKDSLQKGESKSLTQMNLESALSILTSRSPIGESKLESTVPNAVLPLSSRINDIPIPKIRHSLEIKRNLNNSEVTGFSTSTKPLQPLINEVAQGTSLVSEKTLDKNEQDAMVTPEKISHHVESTAVKTKQEEKVPAEILYPDDLNPFGDDMEEEEYPDDLNPFGDDEETTASSSKTVTADDYDESKNPFASDDDDVDASTPIKTKPVTPKPTVTSPSSPFSNPNSMYTSPTGSLRGTMKKRLAPKPPKLSDIFPTQAHDSEGDVSLSSLKSSPSPSIDRKSLHTPSPKVRRNKPTAPPPPIPTGRQTSQTDLAASTKQMKEADNLKIKSTGDVRDAPKAAPKKKKRPAPPVPIPKRMDNKKIPLKDILKEMREIEEKQRECERQGRELELLIRDKDKDEEPSIEEEEYIMQLFELVNQKNALFRRQAELMYIKRSQRLEEQQAEIQTQIRELLMKPVEEKSEEDKAKEEMLILELKDIVDQRSSIIDSIEMDRRRELEEDASVQEQLEIKNGDLPITAEIKEKSSGKDKKSKAKKEKKEKKEKKSKKK